MKHLFVKSTVLGIFFLLASFSCKEKPLQPAVIMLRGNITITSENSKTLRPMKLGELLHQGDVIQTGDNSGVVLNIKETGSYIEIQSNAIFRLSALKKDRVELFAQTGNVWVKTDKKSNLKEQYFKLVTPTMTAAVRGTTFYVFTIEDMEGVCHCNGDVDVSRSSSAYKAEHHTDDLVISKGDKSILLTPEDLKQIGLKHNHSIFEKSPIGPQNQLSPKEYKTFVAFLRKKLAQAK